MSNNTVACPCTCPTDPKIPIPPPLPVIPTLPDVGRMKPEWGGDMKDPTKWSVVPMKDNPKLFKIIDAAKKNVYDNIPTAELAKQIITYYVWKVTNSIPDPLNPDLKATFGVRSIAGNGLVITNYAKNFRSDGRRLDFTVPFTSSQLTFYIRLLGSVNDEISGKWSRLPHSKGIQSDCYDIGIGILSGDARWRFEKWHPDYSDNLGKGLVKAKPQGKLWMGYTMIKKVLPDGNVLLESYQDQGNNEGNTPANNWVKISSWIDKKYKVLQSPFVTARVDDPKKEGLKELEVKWAFVQQIK